MIENIRHAAKVKQKMNWQLKLLISSFVTSLAFGLIQVIRRHINKNHSEELEQNDVTETVL